MANMNIFDKMIAKLTENPKTIVFTEGTDARILEASARLLKDKFLKPILVGNVEEVKAAAQKNGLRLMELRLLIRTILTDSRRWWNCSANFVRKKA